MEFSSNFFVRLIFRESGKNVNQRVKRLSSYIKIINLIINKKLKCSRTSILN